MSDSHQSGPVRHYYVAVGYHEAKIGTLFELLRALQGKATAGTVICCNARDSLDYVCSTAMGFPEYKVLPLHSDLSEQNIDATVKYFKRKTTPNDPQNQPPNGNNPPNNGDNNSNSNAVDTTRAAVQDNAASSQQQPQRYNSAGIQQQQDGDKTPQQPTLPLLITTDSPLKTIDKDLTPIGPLLLINYDLPTRKDNYMRRMSTVLGSRSTARRQRITINFVEAGKLGDLKAYEAMAERNVEEMPVHAMDIFE